MPIGISKIGSLIALIIVSLSYLSLEFFESRLLHSDVRDVALESLPYTLGSWKGTDTDGLEARALGILKLDRFVKRIYRDDKGRSVFVYVGYWKKQTGEHQAAKHSPMLCLPGSGWTISRPEARLLNPTDSQGPFSASRLVGEIRDSAHVFYYWFFSGRKVYHRESEALLNIIYQTFVHRRSDGGIVEIMSPVRGNEERAAAVARAEKTVEDFVNDFQPALDSLLE